MYIKLEANKSLIITSVEPIYRGEHLSEKITYLIPKILGKVDMLSSFVYLNYIRGDGVADVVSLVRMEEEYNEDYYQYTFPIICKLTRFPGEICTWLHILTGDGKKPTVLKSGECILRVEDSKSMDCYLEDRHLTALYQIDKQIEEVNVELSGKADGFEYDDEGNALHLTSKGEIIGESLDVNDMVEDIMKESDMYDVIDFSEGEYDGGTWEKEEDDVIEFGDCGGCGSDDDVIEFGGSSGSGDCCTEDDGVIEFGGSTSGDCCTEDDGVIEFGDKKECACTGNDDGVIEFKSGV